MKLVIIGVSVRVRELKGKTAKHSGKDQAMDVFIFL
jgi:hypothetical protein